MNPIRIGLIGDLATVIDCGRRAMQAGHVVAVVVSADESVLSSAQEWGATRVRSESDRLDPAAQSALLVAKLDVLVSVTSWRAVPVSLLTSVPTCLFAHDGIMPGSSGDFALNRAIREGRATSGVSWLLGGGGPGEGEVIAVESFPIGPADNARDANIAAYDATVRSFLPAVDAARRRDRTPLPVRGEAQLRPWSDTDAILDVRGPADVIERTVRALDYGGSRAELGEPLILVGDLVVAVIGPLEIEEISSASPPPGTVLSVGDERLSLVVSDAQVTFNSPRLVGRRSEPLASVLLPGMRIPPVRAELIAASRTAVREVLTPNSTVLDVPGPQLPWAIPDRAPEQFARLALLDSPELSPWLVEAGFVALISRTTGASRFRLLVVDDDARAKMTNGAPELFAEAWATAVQVEAGSLQSLARDLAEQRAHLLLRPPPSLREVTGDPAFRAPLGPHVERTVAVIRASMNGSDGSERGVSLALVLDDSGAWLCGDLRHFFEADLVAFAEQLKALLDALTPGVDTAIGELRIRGESDQLLLERLNGTAVEFDLFDGAAQQVSRALACCGDRTALVFGDSRVTFDELRAWVGKQVENLRLNGVQPGDFVGVHLARSTQMVVSVLAIGHLGAAYLPLDPEYPKDRLEFMVRDSGVTMVLTDNMSAATVLFSDVVCLQPCRQPAPAEYSDPLPDAVTVPSDPAYMIYTSGSTGVPKGVVVEQGNLANFFLGMDAVVEHDPPGVWLAVTSLSFDISILELIWTIARGFTVVVAGGPIDARRRRPLALGLGFFASDGSEHRNARYDTLLAACRMADDEGLAAVWVPERHFHEFGGSYPSPAVLAGAIAVLTDRIRIHAGSVVLPLHDPLLVAEEWSVVDNLSNGRVGIAFASGWHPNDFAVLPSAYSTARARLPEQVETVRAAWRGDAIPRVSGVGESVDIRTLPRPVQAELPVWLASGGSPATFALAGSMGANVLTHLLGQDFPQLMRNIETYRAARKKAGHAGEGTVTVMAHTFIHERAQEIAGPALRRYLDSSLDLIGEFSSAWAGTATDATLDGSLGLLDDQDRAALIDHAVTRFLSNATMIGTPAECERFLERLREVGADEVSCLIDFGVAHEDLLQGVRAIAVLNRRERDDASETSTTSLPQLIASEHVTHLQCTPSLARFLTSEPAGWQALRSLQHLLVGGEALPPTLARELRTYLDCRVTNMYGPTETTIWSTSAELVDPHSTVSVGTPLANTAVEIVDSARRPVPIGAFGEVCIGGLGVARGYLGREELTNERFFVADYSSDEHAPNPLRYYATGDIGRIRRDGVIELAGRSDQQVKVRGYRIELGEIEHVIEGLPGVGQAVVVARNDDLGGTELTAYCVLETTHHLGSIRSQLQQLMPDYMHPARIVQIDAVPLTPNGKVDRSRVAAARVLADEFGTGTPGVDPAAGLESLVHSVWCECLGLSEVGADRNFFDVGGHSLLAVKMYRVLTEEHALPLTLTDVFQYPTIQSLANRISRTDDGLQDFTASAERGRVRRNIRRRKPGLE